MLGPAVYLACPSRLDKAHAILQIWLLNPTGKANAVVEIDLAQKHLNFLIKVSLISTGMLEQGD